MGSCCSLLCPIRRPALSPDGISDNYSMPLVLPTTLRHIPIVCTLRPHETVQPARTRVLDWVREAVATWPSVLKGSISKDNRGHRRQINSEYLEWMHQARIIVTCNPSSWEGDFRLWEALEPEL